MKLLAAAIAIASDAHKYQFQRNGMPYILHPLHVMRQIEKHPAEWMTKTALEVTMCVAVLHDVIEDSDWTGQDIYQNLYKVYKYTDDIDIWVIVDAVVAMTKIEGEVYSDYLARVKANKYARQVKLADLRHNSDLRRLPGVKQKDIDRLKKYSEAYIYLMEE